MRKTRTGMETTVKSVLIGLFIGLAVMSVGCAAAAYCIHREILPERALRYLAWGACAAGTAAACLTAQAGARKARLPVCMTCGALLVTVLLTVRLLLPDAPPAQWTCAAIVGAAALVSALAGAGRGKRR